MSGDPLQVSDAIVVGPEGRTITVGADTAAPCGGRRIGVAVTAAAVFVGMFGPFRWVPGAEWFVAWVASHHDDTYFGTVAHLGVSISTTTEDGGSVEWRDDRAGVTVGHTFADVAALCAGDGVVEFAGGRRYRLDCPSSLDARRLTLVDVYRLSDDGVREPVGADRRVPLTTFGRPLPSSIAAATMGVPLVFFGGVFECWLPGAGTGPVDGALIEVRCSRTVALAWSTVWVATLALWVAVVATVRWLATSSGGRHRRSGRGNVLGPREVAAGPLPRAGGGVMIGVGDERRQRSAFAHFAGVVATSTLVLVVGCTTEATEIDGEPQPDAELVALRAQVADLYPQFRRDTLLVPHDGSYGPAAAVWALPNDVWCAADLVPVGGEPFGANGAVYILRSTPVCASVADGFLAERPPGSTRRPDAVGDDSDSNAPLPTADMEVAR